MYSLKNQKILFLTLYTHSLTGGIEKVCRTLIDVFNMLKQSNSIKDHVVRSLHDEKNLKYHKGFSGNKIKFGLSALRQSFTADVILLSHIHLLPIAKLIRKWSPSKRIILFAHGIEVWKPLAKWKQEFLNEIEIWAVSNYTAEQLQKVNHVQNKNINVLNHSLPKDYSFSPQIDSAAYNPERYQVALDEKLILTVCRLSSSEQYKGYDMILLALKDVIKTYPKIKYIIAGKADEIEEQRLFQLIQDCRLQDHIILPGYLSDRALQTLYQMADIFAMPSKGEGFGLVFLEAVANGCAVLAGDADGSRDALLNGDLGLLVDPADGDAIYQGLMQLLTTPVSSEVLLERQVKVRKHFGFEKYVDQVEELLCIEKIHLSS